MSKTVNIKSVLDTSLLGIHHGTALPLMHRILSSVHAKIPPLHTCYMRTDDTFNQHNKIGSKTEMLTENALSYTNNNILLKTLWATQLY